MYLVRVELYCILCVFASVCLSQDYATEQETCDTEHESVVSRQFALSLYKTASKLMAQTRNLLLSPLAVGMLLSMVSHGTSPGTPRNEILQVLKQGDRQDIQEFDRCTLSAYNADRFNTPFVIRDKPRRNTARLRTATRLFGDRNLTFDADFVTKTGIYGTEMTVLPIRVNPRLAERQINRWVSRQTDGIVNQIIKRNSLQNNAKIAATCSIFFTGTWSSPFLNASRGVFYRQGKRKRSTDFITSQSPVQHLSSKKLQADLVKIPYDVPDGSNIDPCLILIMPHKGTPIRRVETGLDDGVLQTLLYGNQSNHVPIRIPKFQLAGSQKLKFFLKRMGIRQIFIEWRSSLRNSLKVGTKYDGKISVASTVNKIRFEVDEYGTQGFVYHKASDAVRANDFPDHEILTYDRPFIFILYDMFTNTVVYVGRLSDPTGRL